MITGSRTMRILIFIGDLVIFIFALWVTLAIRSLTIPSVGFFVELIQPFSILFILWIFVFILAGLYDKRALISRRSLPERIVRVQVLNIILAALFFFLVPEFGITPKTILVIYLVVSLLLILLWRLTLFPYLSKHRLQQKAVIIGTGGEVEELARELNTRERYSIVCYATLNPDNLSPKELSKHLMSYQKEGVSNIIVDAQDPHITPLLPVLYSAVFEDHIFELAQLVTVYEDVFERVPLSLLRYDWMFIHAIRHTSFGYSVLKRSVDIIGGILMGVITLIVLPFIWLTLRIEGRGDVFIAQDRFGMYGLRMRVYKFRTMRFNDRGVWGAWKGESANTFTRVGSALQRISLDEFPQFINILRGELSLVGPRNDIVAIGERLEQELPYYTVRYMVKPGITGWAQVNQQYEQGNISPQSIEETKTRLAYDFYYIKYRSFMLDIAIALKTFKRILFRMSSS